MATRFVYKAIEEAPFVRKVPVEFEWFGGFSLVQKRRCIASLHRAVFDSLLIAQKSRAAFHS